MRRLALCLVLVGSFVLALAEDANEVMRTTEDVYKPLHATKSVAEAMHKIDAKFGSQLTKLRHDHPADYLIKRDALNEKYTHDFMGAMSPVQKSTYRKYIRSLRQSYIKAHPDVDADNIFIWGGANLL
ncbi:MAG: hypothetical protein P4L46_04140 [Fimbriimonas sp.]|nr:hypothetical protein [Fimbriimonas sp.]